MQHTALPCRWGIWKKRRNLRRNCLPCFLIRKYTGKVCGVSPQHTAVWSGWLSVYCFTRCREKRKRLPIIPVGNLIWRMTFRLSQYFAYERLCGCCLGIAGSEVGVDIEQYGERVRKVAHKFMREDEQPSVFRGTDTWSLLLHWSAKETMFKCLNASEVDFRGHMRILPFAVNVKAAYSPPKNIVRWRNAGSLFIIICFRILS